MDKLELAKKYFHDGYNCCQSVVMPFSGVLSLDLDFLAKISSGFGGGISRLRETCGAASGMVIVLNLLYGYSDSSDFSLKQNHYALVQKLLLEFEKENGSLVCRELLKKDVNHDNPTPSKRTEEFYKNRPCERMILSAVKILDDYITCNK